MLVGCLFSGAIVYVYASPSLSSIIEAGSMTDTVSYVIFKDGSTIYAKNGETGAIDYTSSNASLVIQYAVDNCPDGNEVRIKATEYILSVTIEINHSIILSGEGDYNFIGAESTKGTKLKTTSNINLIEITGSGWGVNAANGVTITQLSLWGNGNTSGGAGIYLDYADQVRIKEVTSENNTYGLYGKRVDACYIADCWFCNTNSYGIYMEEPYFTKIVHNEISDNSKSGIAIVRPSAERSYVRIIDNGLKDNYEYGMYLVNLTSLYVGANFIHSSGWSGIYMHWVSTSMFIGNVITENVQSGINMSDSDSNIFDGNFISRNDDGDTQNYDGLVMYADSDENQIGDNRFFDNDRYNIYIAESDCDYNQITGASTRGTDQVAGIIDSGTNTKITASWNGSDWIATYP